MGSKNRESSRWLRKRGLRAASVRVDLKSMFRANWREAAGKSYLPTTVIHAGGTYRRAA